MKSLCRSRTELPQKDLMGEQTHFWGQASTKITRGAPLQLLFIQSLRDCMKTPDRPRTDTPPSGENGLTGLYFGVLCYRRATIGASPTTFHTLSPRTSVNSARTCSVHRRDVFHDIEEEAKIRGPKRCRRYNAFRTHQQNGTGGIGREPNHEREHERADQGAACRRPHHVPPGPGQHTRLLRG